MEEKNRKGGKGKRMEAKKEMKSDMTGNERISIFY